MQFILIAVTVKTVHNILELAKKMKEPSSNTYPFLSEENKHFKEFQERVYIMNWELKVISYQKIPAAP